MIAVDPERGFEENGAIKRGSLRRQPYGRWLDEGLRPRLERDAGRAAGRRPDRRARRLFGYTREDVNVILRPSPAAATSRPPRWATTPRCRCSPVVPVPSTRYFRQRFAQVTNPPIDHLRERHAFSLRRILGGRAPLLTEGPEAARGTEFESFFLYPDALDELR